jgi:hypothetical protein
METLCDYLEEKIKNNLQYNSAFVITMSEFCQTGANLLNYKLPETVDWRGGPFKGVYSDYTATYWNAIGWQPVTRDKKIYHGWSDTGKYSAVVLEHENPFKRVMYVSVHLPRQKVKQRQAFTDLGQLFDEAYSEKFDVHDIIVAGDFNAKPRQIEGRFGPDFHAGVRAGRTTKAGRLIDNVVTTGGITANIHVSIKDDRLTHYPLFGTLMFQD